MDNHTRIQRLEREQQKRTNDAFSAKTCHYDFGLVDSVLLEFEATQNSPAVISVTLSDSADLCVVLNGIEIASNNSSNLSLPVTLVDNNTLAITLNSAKYTSVDVVGNVKYAQSYPSVVGLSAHLVGMLPESVCYAQLPSLGQFVNIYANSQNVASVRTVFEFNSVVYLCQYDGESIALSNLVGGSPISSFEPANQPLSLALFVDANQSNVFVASLEKDCVRVYNLTGGEVCSCPSAGVSNIRSVGGALPMQFACTLRGATCVCTLSNLGQNASLEYNALSHVPDAHVAYSESQYYAIHVTSCGATVRVLSDSYALVHSFTVSPAVAVCVHVGKVYAVYHNKVNLVYESNT